MNKKIGLPLLLLVFIILSSVAVLADTTPTDHTPYQLNAVQMASYENKAISGRTLPYTMKDSITLTLDAVDTFYKS